MSDPQAVRDYESLDELLEHIEALVRQGTAIDITGRTRACLGADVTALRILAQHGRFRIVTEIADDQVTGFWPERDPLTTKGGAS